MKRKPLLTEWLCVGFLLLSTPFYFLDPTFLPKSAVAATQLLLCAAIAVVVGKRIGLRPAYLLLASYFIAQHLAKINGQDEVDWMSAFRPNPLPYAFIVLFLSLPWMTQRSVCDKYLRIFGWIHVPMFIIGVLFVMGFQMSYRAVHLGGRDLWYRVYYGIAVISEDEMRASGIYRTALVRMGGLFEEPGMLGTIVALLIIVNRLLFPRERKREILLLAIGCVSMSFAFFLFAFMYGAYLLCDAKSIATRRAAIMAGLFVATLVLAWPVMPDSIHWGVYRLVFRKFALGDEGGGLRLGGDSRYWGYRDQYAEYYDTATPFELWTGHGAGANERDSQAGFGSYQGIIYDSGYLGLGLLVAWLAYFAIYVPVRSRQGTLIPLTIFVLLNLYQRPMAVSAASAMVYSAIIIGTRLSAEERVRAGLRRLEVARQRRLAAGGMAADAVT